MPVGEVGEVGELVLVSGRNISLKSLQQYRTYGGLLEGLPTVEMNRQDLAHLVAEHPGAYVIPPVERPIPYEGKYPFGTPSALPSTTCIGRFTSTQPARDKSRDFSQLVIIWFQMDYAFPIAPDVLEKLLAINWNAHALDDEY